MNPMACLPNKKYDCVGTSLMNKTLTIALLLTSSSSLAGNLSVTYDGAKLAQCSVSMEYFDGNKSSVTCEVEDKGTFRIAGSTVTLNCQKGGEVEHIHDDASAVLILSNCIDIIKGVQVKETHSSGASNGADSFWLRANDKSGIKNKIMAKESSDGCYKRVSIAGSKIRVLIGQALTLDRNCKTTTL